jgi:hypothetical protein
MPGGIIPGGIPGKAKGGIPGGIPGGGRMPPGMGIMCGMDCSQAP